SELAMGKICKVVVCGMKGVGKTAILEQVIYGNINDKSQLHPTIEDIYIANIESDKGTREKLRFYDTAGIEHSQITTANGITNQQLPRHYLILADGYILVYDIGKKNVLVTIIVIANKIKGNEDNDDFNSTLNKATQWCNREKIKHFTATALKRSSLYEPFMYITSKLNPPPSKSSFTPLSMGRKVIKDSS
ncbi:hypothetical protein NQ314_007481, partial [Rhamnusium bicolor]